MWTCSASANTGECDYLGIRFLYPDIRFTGPKESVLYISAKGTRRQTLSTAGQEPAQAGTENIPGIGLGQAAELAMENRDAESSRLQDLRSNNQELPAWVSG